MNKGFTTVELMATLIVASLFLFSGYQLFSVVSYQSGQARNMGEASNIGYKILRQQTYSAVANPCSSPLTQNVVVPAGELPSPTNITVEKCKPFSDSSLIKVVVVVEYGDKGGRTVHATYLNDD